MSLDSIVSVDIQAGSAQPTRAGFGTPVLMGAHSRFTESFRSYDSLSGMLSDGFLVSDPLYMMASAVFSASPRPEKVLVGRMVAALPQAVLVDLAGIVAGETAKISIMIDGVEVDFEAAFDTDADTTAANLEALIDASALALTSSVTGSEITIIADNNGDMMFFDNMEKISSFQDITPDLGYNARLAELLVEGADFYGVAVENNSPANVASLATFVAANKKIGSIAPQLTNFADFDAAGDALVAATANRMYGNEGKRSRAQFADAAFLGMILPKDPGSITAAFNSLLNVEADALTSNDISVIEAHGGSHYSRLQGLNITRQGKAYGGEWLDVTIGLDWLTARLQERCYALLYNNDKVPFTDGGIDLVATEVRAQLIIAEERGVLEPGSSQLTVRKKSALDSADIAARHLRAIEFEARLAGAIHKIILKGTVSV